MAGPSSLTFGQLGQGSFRELSERGEVFRRSRVRGILAKTAEDEKCERMKKVATVLASRQAKVRELKVGMRVKNTDSGTIHQITRVVAVGKGRRLKVFLDGKRADTNPDILELCETSES